MLIAGVDLSDRATLELCSMLRIRGYEYTALHIERAYDAVAPTIGLAPEECEEVIRTLDDCPSDLSTLRDVLIRQRRPRKPEQSGLEQSANPDASITTG